MSFRPITRLLAFAISISIGIAGLSMLRAENWAGLLVGGSCMVVAVSGMVVSVFGIPVFGNSHPDSGFGVLSERQGVSVGSVLIFLFGALLIFLAARGVYRGAMPALTSGQDIVLAQAPLRYLLAFAAWFGAGAGLLWLSWKVARQPQPQPQRQRKAGGTPGRRGKSSDA